MKIMHDANVKDHLGGLAATALLHDMGAGVLNMPWTRVSSVGDTRWRVVMIEPLIHTVWGCGVHVPVKARRVKIDRDFLVAHRSV